jgi:hypothetical protein
MKCEGWLWKKGELGLIQVRLRVPSILTHHMRTRSQTWKRRVFVLKEETLVYYKDAEHKRSGIVQVRVRRSAPLHVTNAL